MQTNEIMNKLERIERLLESSKKVLNVDELADYTGFSKSYIYKLVHRNTIPYSKPNGKILFFEKEKIDAWLISSQAKSQTEIEREAQNYVLKRKKHN